MCQDIERLIDIRRCPVSRRYPQYSRSLLQTCLAAAGIRYQWEGNEACAWTDSPHIGLVVDSLRGYAGHLVEEQFGHTMRDVLALAGQNKTAFMCAKRQQEYRRRNLVVGYLLVRSCRVVHLIAVGMVREHRLVREIDSRLIYNRDMTLPLDSR